MAFRTNPAPYQRSKNSTLKIMLILLAALVVVWVSGIIYYFNLSDKINEYIELENLELDIEEQLPYVDYGLKAILNVIVAVVTSIVCDVIHTLCVHKTHKNISLGKDIIHTIVHNYSYITGIIFALTLPVFTSYYVIIVGSVFATLVCKNVFGGFGKNIFNPAIMARIFVGLCFGSALATPEIIQTVSAAELAGEAATAVGVDAATGSTITSVYNNSQLWIYTTRPVGAAVIENSLIEGFTLENILFGEYVGALGETFTVLILGLGIVLSVLGVINWRTPAFYLGTVALSAVVIATLTGNSVLAYLVASIGLGGVAFGAVFMLTDPVTGPTSSLGKSICAIFAGFMTVLIRIKGGYPEGAMFSIALANLISPAIDAAIKGKTNRHYPVKVAGLGLGVVIAAICLGFMASGQVTHIGVVNKDGLNYAQDAQLQSAVALNENERYCKYSDDVEVGYTFSNESTLDSKYLVKNGDEVVAYAYVIDYEKAMGSKASISAEGYPIPLNVVGLVVIDKQDKVQGVGFIDEKMAGTDTSYYGKFVSEQVVGNGQAAVDALVCGKATTASKSTYSPQIIKDLVNKAYQLYALESK